VENRAVQTRSPGNFQLGLKSAGIKLTHYPFLRVWLHNFGLCVPHHREITGPQGLLEKEAPAFVGKAGAGATSGCTDRESERANAKRFSRNFKPSS
jgi:hypothetical protein